MQREAANQAGKARRRRPSIDDLLDREEARALNQLADAAHRAGEDFCTRFEVRERIRGHPWVSLALGAATGFVGGAPLLRVMARAATFLIPVAKTASQVLGRPRTIFEPPPAVSARILEKIHVRELLRRTRP
jgi:ElaB/YqjD/DUF883 family membrane-anchored ribosome-binding protein